MTQNPMSAFWGHQPLTQEHLRWVCPHLSCSHISDWSWPDSGPALSPWAHWGWGCPSCPSDCPESGLGVVGKTLAAKPSQSPWVPQHQAATSSHGTLALITFQEHQRDWTLKLISNCCTGFNYFYVSHAHIQQIESGIFRNAGLMLESYSQKIVKHFPWSHMQHFQILILQCKTKTWILQMVIGYFSLRSLCRLGEEYKWQRTWQWYYTCVLYYQIMKVVFICFLLLTEAKIIFDRVNAFIFSKDNSFYWIYTLQREG